MNETAEKLDKTSKMYRPKSILRNQRQTEPDPDDDLLVFGYACKLYPPDENARFVGKERHLILWNGDPEVNLLIDRYDARASLHDLSEFIVDSWNIQSETSEEESRVERLCDAERYLALHTNIRDTEIAHEEEMKRLHAVINDGHAQVGFNYSDNDQSQQPKQLPSTNEIKEEEEKPFLAPPSLAVPNDIEIPATEKTHKIIEKTALFVSKQGAQMEIVLKAKQSNNSQFHFLQFDHYLNPYYKHMVKRMKEGKYSVIVEPEPQEEESSSDEEGGYLHPSLFAQNNKPPASQPKVAAKVDPEHPLARLIERGRRTNAIKQITRVNEMVDKYYAQDVKDKPSDLEFNSAYQLMCDAMEHVVVPPPNLQPVIDNIAQQIAQHGHDEQQRLANAHDGLLEFLQPGSELHPYFIYRKVVCIQQIQLVKRQTEELRRQRQLLEQAKKPATISFEIKQSVEVSNKKTASNPLKDDGSESEEDKEETNNRRSEEKTNGNSENVPTEDQKPRKRFTDHPPDGVKEQDTTKDVPPSASGTILSQINAMSKQKESFAAVTPSGEKSSLATIREKQAERKQKALFFLMNKTEDDEEVEDSNSPKPEVAAGNEDIFADDDVTENKTESTTDPLSTATTLKGLITSSKHEPSPLRDTSRKKSRSRSADIDRRSRKHRSRSRDRRSRSNDRRSRSRDRKSRDRRSRSTDRRSRERRSRSHGKRSRVRRSLSKGRRSHSMERSLPSSYNDRRSSSCSPTRKRSHDNVPSAYKHMNKRKRRSKSRERKKKSKRKKHTKSKKSSRDKKKKRKAVKSSSSSSGELSDTPERT